MTYRVPTVVAGSAGTTTGNVQIARPAALRVGDLIVLAVSTDGAAAGMQAPAGFLSVLAEITQDAIQHKTWYKFADHNEPTTFDVTFTASGNVLYNLFIVRGADPTTVVDVVDYAHSAAILPIAEPGVTTTVDNCLAVSVLAFEDSPRVIVQPTGWTLLESRDGSAGTLAQAICYKTIATAGASGGANWTATDSASGDYVAVTFAIRPGVMSLTATALYAPQDMLAKTLADCSEFRNLVGATSHAEAQAHIWHESLPLPSTKLDSYTKDELEEYRPFALIFTNDMDGSMASRQATSPGAWADRGALRILLEVDTPTPLKDSPVLLDQWMKQLVGRICRRPTDESSSTFFGLMELAHTTTTNYSYLAIDDVNFRGYHRSNVREQPSQGDYHFAWIEVLYGQRGGG